MILARNDEVLVRRHHGELTLVFDDTLYKLNAVGEDVWRMVDGKKTQGDLIQSMCGLYDADKGEIGSDIEGFLSDLIRDGLVFEK
ncbi:PqqD family protein [Thalassococcus sp. S3]|uniref:PqqD family protein n=1 Tax=Thalassococcus sp. S3 TaxID=2017482 RepID=UPI0010243932|nr:PqqD family protein [Thalassococcus sp. S3]QBF29637.1 hypothetical protein CFI11_00205 [Thalassococcus sp. S3]